MLKLNTLALTTALVAAATPGQTVSGTPAAPTGFPLAITASAETTGQAFGYNGYACIRRGFNYVFPMYSIGNVVGSQQSTIINAFYQTAISQLGAISATVAGAANDSSGCFISVAAAANCALVWNGASPIANRIKYIGNSVYATSIAQPLNIDFVLAATYQDSYSGTGTRTAAPGNYCDQQLTILTEVGANKTLMTTEGLTGLTKCTYFVRVAADKGAPAFKITILDYWKFQLHYLEWSSADMTTNNYINTNMYVGTISHADTFPSPFAT